MKFGLNTDNLRFAGEGGGGEFEKRIIATKIENPSGGGPEAPRSSPLLREMTSRLKVAQSRLDNVKSKYEQHQNRTAVGKAVRGLLGEDPTQAYNTSIAETQSLQNAVEALHQGNEQPAKNILSSELER